MKKQRSAAATRQKILDAAIQRFSNASYEDVTLRNLAADVGIDVALVHRHFGSKEELFRQAIKAASQMNSLMESDADKVTDVILQRIFTTAEAQESVDALHIFVRSLSSSRARDVLRDSVVHDFIAPLSQKFEQPTDQRAALLMAFLAGLAIMRDVIGIEALQGDETSEFRHLTQAVLAVCLTHEAQQDD